MKKIVYPPYHTHLQLSEDYVNAICIENPQEFRTIVTEFYNQIDGYSGSIVLSKDNEPIPLSKGMELVQQFVPFDCNSKALQTKICAAMEKTSVDESHYVTTQELVCSVRAYLESLLFNYQFSFDFEKLSMPTLIKAAGVRLYEEEVTPIEQILTYLRAMRDFLGDKVVVFINMRSYFSSSDMQSFIDEVILRKYEVLLIDNQEYPLLNNECRLVIDADLCEITKMG